MLHTGSARDHSVGKPRYVAVGWAHDVPGKRATKVPVTWTSLVGPVAQSEWTNGSACRKSARMQGAYAHSFREARQGVVARAAGAARAGKQGQAGHPRSRARGSDTAKKEDRNYRTGPPTGAHRHWLWAQRHLVSAHACSDAYADAAYRARAALHRRRPRMTQVHSTSSRPMRRNARNDLMRWRLVRPVCQHWDISRFFLPGPHSSSEGVEHHSVVFTEV